MSPRTTGLPAQAHARRLTPPLAFAAALALLAGCGGSSDEDQPAADDGPTAAAWQIEVANVAGRLPVAGRAKLASQVEATLSSFVDNALVASPPASDAFGGFTRGGAKQAEKDRALLTSEGFADGAAGAAKVVPTRLGADLSVLTPHAKPAGATARVDIVLDVDGQPVTLAGTLLLTPTADGWKIFGYDLQREGVN